MTGFGAASGRAGGCEVRVEVRSVNHRHLLVKTRLPQEFSHLDAEVEARVRKKLKRGSVTLHVNAARPTAAEAARVNVDVAERYRRQLAKLSKSFGGNGEVSLEAVLSLPGVIGAPDDMEDLDKEAKGILRWVDEAVSRLVEMRETEGRAIEDDLRRNAAAVEKQLDRIERRMPAVVKRHQESLKRRVDELLGGRSGVDPADLSREIAVLADRLDVSEEIVRLRSHTEQLESFLAKGGNIGRKLDFLVQEIFREANTIGSKCNDAQVAHRVVELKTLIERLREQVQNVE
ncbi:MAG: YicC family protein [Planctomycetota bacterium]|nr:YicC family protein [Planctomycetota bacterium]